MDITITHDSYYSLQRIQKPTIVNCYHKKSPSINYKTFKEYNLAADSINLIIEMVEQLDPLNKRPFQG